MDVLWLGDRKVDLDAGSVTRFGHAEPLLPKERDLLRALAAADGGIVSKADLLTSVWGYSERARSRTVDTTLRRLRRKIETHADQPVFLRTIRGQGLQLLHVRRGEPSARIRCNAPPARPLFGRVTEAEELYEADEPILLTGPLGIGKTALALHLLDRWGREGGSAIYIDASRIDSMVGLGTALGEALEIDASPTEALEACRLLHEPLVVIDHAERVPTSVLAQLVAGMGAQRLLLCSRVVPDIPDLQVRSLARLALDPATELLRSEARPYVLTARDVRLASAAGGVPIVLVLLGRFVAGLGADADRWLLDLEGATGLTLRALLELEFEQLGPEERRLLGACAAFSGGFDIEALAYVAERPVPVVARQLRTLHQRSLVVREGETLRLPSHVHRFAAERDLHRERVVAWCAALRDETFGVSTVRALRHWGDLEEAVMGSVESRTRDAALTLYACALRCDRTRLAEETLRRASSLAGGELGGLLDLLVYRLRLRHDRSARPPSVPEFSDAVVQRLAASILELHVSPETPVELLGAPWQPGSVVWLWATVSVAAIHVLDPLATTLLRRAVVEARASGWPQIVWVSCYALALEASFAGRDEEAMTLLESHDAPMLERSYYEIACRVHVHINRGALDVALAETTPWVERARARRNRAELNLALYNRLVIQFAMGQDAAVLQACVVAAEEVGGNVDIAVRVLRHWMEGTRPSVELAGPLHPFTGAPAAGPPPELSSRWDAASRLFSRALYRRWNEAERPRLEDEGGGPPAP